MTEKKFIPTKHRHIIKSTFDFKSKWDTKKRYLY